jgi:dTDP-4-amino-4,6-dideoxygalactose transaminase
VTNKSHSLRSQPGNKLHVGRPNLGDRAVFDKLVDEIFERRWFTNNGLVVQEFESKLCDYLGVKHCIPVCNATVGLQLVCHALELTGEVILPAFTFVATAHAVHWEGLKPVFADVDLETHTICPDSVESLITEQTSAIAGVHVWGHPCQTERLDQIADNHGLAVMYDAAHAFGCAQLGKMIGNFGRCEVFSFHATKFFNTFEGGAIATNDDELAEKIRLMTNFGFAGMDNVVTLGTNAKMMEISAAMGLSVFCRLDEILLANQTNYLRYQERLGNTAGLRLYSYDHLERTNWQYIVLEIDESQYGSSRDQVFQRLLDNDVIARRYFFPGCHKMEPYRSLYPDTSDRLENTEMLCQSVLCLPTGSAVSTRGVDRICDLILAATQ